MAIFSNKVVSAKFIDRPNNMLIEVLYEDNDQIIPYTLEVDFTSNDFNDLLAEVTLEEIEENTLQSAQLESKHFEKMITEEIQRRWAIEEEKITKAYAKIDAYAEKKYKDLDEYAETEKLKKFEEVQTEFKELRKTLQDKFSVSSGATSEITGKDLLSIIDLKDNDDDFIFNVKIAILEDPSIAKSKDKSLKLSIRKSKSLWDLLNLYTSARG